MTDLLKPLSFVILAALAMPAAAQQADDTTGEEEAPDAMGLSMGEEVSSEDQPGDIYVLSEHSAWQLRCIRSDAPVDPCQLYQLLDDGNGNPVAEINVFPLAEPGDAVAGATVITPLETLLTQQLTVSVDGGEGKRYPFSWCSQIGCFSRVGLTAADIAAFKRGNSAVLTIVPVAAPDQKVNLNVSLSGFTAAYTASEEQLAKLQAAMAEAAEDNN